MGSVLRGKHAQPSSSKASKPKPKPQPVTPEQQLQKGLQGILGL